ncbi:MAG: glycosyltransferase family 4 protein [Deltaproteobacteria bacterium]|nr:glycosyltransferase family 4 protein [Deltaproteobacteria bacterium]
MLALGRDAGSRLDHMNILMLADVFFPDTTGGAGKVLHNLCAELSTRGHEVHVITRNPCGRLPAHEVVKPGFRVHRFLVDQSKPCSMLFNELRNSSSSVQDVARMVPFDFLCIHQAFAATGPVLLSRFLKDLPLVYFFHSPWHEEFLIKDLAGAKIRYRLGAPLLRTIERKLVSRASLVTVLSDFMGDKVSREHGFPEGRIRKLPCGIDLRRFVLPPGDKTVAKKRAGIPPDRVVFLTIRNLVPRMGLDSLIRAVHKSATIKEKGLLFIGGSGALEGTLKQMVKDLDLDGTIRFLGYLPEDRLPETYQWADFFVLPTRQLEGFGLVILESMACGTPVLGTPVGAIPEIIGAFDKRLLFDGPGWQDLARKIELVIEERERYSFDPMACRRFVEENYSWAKMAEHFEKQIAEFIPFPCP